MYHTPYNALLLLKGWVSLDHGWKSRRQGSTACQDWAVFIVSSLKENESSTRIKIKLAKTEYNIFLGTTPPPASEPPPPASEPPPPPPSLRTSPPPVCLPTTRKTFRPHPLFRAIM